MSATEHGALTRGPPQPLGGGGEGQESRGFAIVSGPQLFLQPGSAGFPPHPQGFGCRHRGRPARDPFLHLDVTFGGGARLRACRVTSYKSLVIKNERIKDLKPRCFHV